jgi:hypothetical protein
MTSHELIDITRPHALSTMEDDAHEGIKATESHEVNVVQVVVRAS